MSIMKSALNTLSEMALLESSVDIPQETSSDICQLLMDDLSQMEYLTEDEMRYDIRMVPIRASKRLGKYLIEMEDLSRYMMTNQITSIKEALGNILEYNNIEGQYHNVGLIIDEDSILNEIESLGYNITTDCWKATPKPGLGMPMIGKDHRDFKYFRDIANTKQLMDLLTGRYGLPLIKKSYNQIGLLGVRNTNDDLQSDEYADNFIAEETEDVKIQPKDGNTVLQEKPLKKNTARFNGAGNNQQNTTNPRTVGPSNTIQESVNPREAYLQQLRDIAAGKYDEGYF